MATALSQFDHLRNATYSRLFVNEADFLRSYAWGLPITQVTEARRMTFARIQLIGQPQLANESCPACRVARGQLCHLSD
jgi:hypothetical protein